jgi:hypothetical protein
MACSSEGPETRVRKLVDEAIGLAERGDAGGLLELTTSDFRVTPSGADRKQLRGRLFFGLQRLGKGRILYPRPSVELDESAGTAAVRFSFLTVQGPRGSDGPARPENQDEESWLASLVDKTRVLRIQLWLRLEDDEWRFAQARLERFTGLGFSVVR